MFPRLPVTLISACAALLTASLSAAESTVHRVPYHGWPEAVVLGNGKVEAVIVPQIGRVMQFRFAGDEDGPFWENRALDGRKPDSQSSEWGNFGGDKTWPAPQGEWEKMTGRGWPPPAAFDSLPVEVKIEGETVVLTSQPDPQYGVQAERRIVLGRGSDEMLIETIYRKTGGKPVRVGIWVITQLKHPELMLMPLPEKSIFPDGYNKQSATLPLNLAVRDGAVRCERSPGSNTKIGSDASRILWAGKSHIVEVFAQRETEGEFPDRGSSAEIYTNADPNAYVELELLGPLHTLSAGDRISRRERYRLFRRNGEAPEVQMRRLPASEREQKD